MSPEEANFFRENLQGSFEGIGARVDWDMTADTVVVVEPFENQPAWKAGIKRGDLITHVDGESILGTDLASAVEKIRGPKDTTVVLTVVRADSTAPFEVEVVRDRIEIPTIESRVVAGNLAYVRLNSFNENAGDLVRDAVEAALEEKPAGLIFDLRGNPGGLLRQAIDVAAVFLPKGQNVLIERFADGREEIYATEVEPVITDLPLVVLVNEGSASASEIVAGAIQDYRRGQLVGTVTYGKGSVQLPHTLSDDSILRVTVARWYTPDDRTIDGSGLQPDVLVELSEADREAQRDPQLEEAIRLLGGEAEALPVE
jgi:carboxyl-terminal processing protease